MASRSYPAKVKAAAPVDSEDEELQAAILASLQDLNQSKEVPDLTEAGLEEDIQWLQDVCEPITPGWQLSLSHDEWQTLIQLEEFGVMTVGVDYRNFPRGCIPDMVEDVGRGVRWVFQNIERYGGDTSNVMLMGQSAGAHLAAMLLLEHGLLEAKHTAEGKEFTDNWSVKDLQGFLGISGPYHLEKLGPHLSSRGLYPGIMTHMTAGDLQGCSPEALLQNKEWQAVGSDAAALLPPLHLFHGDQDKAVPVWSSEQFAKALKEAGANVILDVRKGMTHTYPVVEGPMRRHDPQVELVLPMLLGAGAEKRISDQAPLPPMAPLRILDVAGIISPF